MSIELAVATRHRRDMTEKLLKPTLNPEQTITTTTKILLCERNKFTVLPSKPLGSG